MTEQQQIMLAQEIVENLGGAENISNVIHCVTRLRFTIIDESKINKSTIENLENVLGFQKQNGQHQIIIGKEVGEVFEKVENVLNISDKTVEAVETKEKFSFMKIFEVVSSIFTPVLPAIVGAGLVKGIMETLAAFAIISKGSEIYQLLNIISDAGFYFLPFLLAITSSKRFKVNEFLGVSLAGILMYPTIINGAVEGGGLTLFGVFKVPFISYASSVIPIIVGIYFMSWVIKGVNKIVPKMLQVILTPFITLLIVAPVTLIVLGPLGNYIGFAIAGSLNTGFGKYPLLFGALVGVFYPLMIVFGMHYATFPILFENMGTLGYDTGFFPIGFISNMSQAGISFAHALITKDGKDKSISLSSGISALFGITEPALFGITMKNRKYLIISMISSGIGSGIALALGVKCFSFIIPGIASIPAYVQPGTNNLLIMLSCIVLSFLISFVGALFIVKKEQGGTNVQK